jgi:hypothetical protein
MPACEWPRGVAIVPPGIKESTNTDTITRTKPTQETHDKVPLSDFYSFESSKEMIGCLEQEQNSFEHAQPGYHAVMIAMRVATREISNWVWSTFW